MSDASSLKPPEGKRGNSSVSRNQCRPPTVAGPQPCSHRAGKEGRSPAGIPPTAGESPEGQTHRDRTGLRCRQTPLTRSIFTDPKTQSCEKSSEESGREGCAAGRSGGSVGVSQRPLIGPPSQQVSRIIPHCRQTSLARISWVGPAQTGQIGVDMPGEYPSFRLPQRTRNSAGLANPETRGVDVQSAWVGGGQRLPPAPPQTFPGFPGPESPPPLAGLP